jgi:hypothetical protein
MHHFQYRVTTRAPRSLAWQIYRNCSYWNSFANIYGEIEWRQGKPWSVGSRLQIEIFRPVHSVVDHLITVHEPFRHIGWVDTACGITLRQWVKFEDAPSGETQVETWGELSPEDVLVAGHTVSYLVDTFTETWYENYRLFCDQFVEAAAQV